MTKVYMLLLLWGLLVTLETASLEETENTNIQEDTMECNNTNTDCITVSGVVTNEPCWFPFKIRDEIHYACTFEGGYSQPWCPTRVDQNCRSNGLHWGNCDPTCPNEKQSTTTTSAPNTAIFGHSDIINGVYVDEVDCKGELVIGINKDNSSKFNISETFMDINFSKNKLTIQVRESGNCCWHVFPHKNCRTVGVQVEDDEEISLFGNSMSAIKFDPINDVCRSMEKTQRICRSGIIPEKKKYVLKNLDENINSTYTVEGYSWSPWSSCTATCGGGNRQRHHCNKLENGTNNCWGKVTQTQRCNTRACPVDGFWSSWGSWGFCSSSCGGGRRVRSRHCNEPQHGGHNCAGDRKETRSCNTHSCYGQRWAQKNDQDCWHHCGGKTGSCPFFCGSGGYCCRKGYGGCPEGTGEASPDKHTCVIRKGVGRPLCKGRNFPGGRECCESSDPLGSKCTEGQGDCDADAGCAGDLVCGRNNCRQYRSDVSPKDDCCTTGPSVRPYS